MCGVTLFAPVLHLNCTALSQSESSNFFMYIINRYKLTILQINPNMYTVDAIITKKESCTQCRIYRVFDILLRLRIRGSLISYQTEQFPELVFVRKIDPSR